MSAEDVTERQPAGIFIPYEKLLENIDSKLDRIEGKLDQKVDSSTFDAFKITYENRHQDLHQRVLAIENLAPKDVKDDVATLKDGRNKLLGAFALAVLLLPTITGIVVHLISN